MVVPVRWANSSPAKWATVPAPPEPKLIESGWSLAIRASSFMLLAGKSLLAATTNGSVASMVTGTKAFSQS